MTVADFHPITTRQPGEIIAYGPEGGITVGQFLVQATTLAEQLPDYRYVLNLAANRYDFLLGFAAAVIAGQCTLMPPNKQRQTLEQLEVEYPDCYAFGKTGIAGIEGYVHDPASFSSGAAAVTVPQFAADQLCAIVFTSGSTGAPTPNRKFWETLRTGSLSNVDLIMGNWTRPRSLLATVPAQHMWGLETSVLLPLFGSVAVSHATPFFPQDIVDAIESLPEPRVLVSSPVHLEALLAANVGPVKIDDILSATAPMSAELARKLESRFGANVMDIFGCSESGIIARRGTAREDLWWLSRTFDLRVSEDDVVIRAAHLSADVVLQDMIERVGDEQFRWLGRRQDMINIAGKRGSLADLNQRLNAIPGVADGVIFLPRSDSKRLAALVVAPDLEPSAILEQLKSGIEPAFLPRPVYTVPSLPRQETGKLARQEIVELFEATRMQRKPDDDGLADSAN